MRSKVLVVVIGAAALVAGCGDSNTGDTNVGPNALFPNGKKHRVTTTIDPTTIAAGSTTTVTCTVFDTANATVETNTVVVVTPTNGITIDGKTVTAAEGGSFRVICSAPDLEVVDDTGATLTVESAGDAATIETTVDPSTVAAGEAATVTCVVRDANGGVLADAETVINAPPMTTLDGDQISSETPGSYDITCSVPGAGALPTTPGTLTVTPGPATAVELLADPVQPVYAREDTVQLSWVVTDAYGNPITSAPGTLTAPTSGLEVIGDPSEHRFKFLEQGYYDFTVTLDAPYDGLTDTLSLVCDDSGPTITITYPPRGATVTGLGNGETITVTGNVTDNQGTVSTIVVNGTAPAVDDEGNFQIDIEPAWGVNFIEIFAEDNWGNLGKLTPSFQYSSQYVTFVETDAEGVKVDDGAQALLGQGALDDGVHDHSDVDDLATLLELVLENLDIPALLESQGGTQITTPIFDIGIGFGVSLGGDLITTVAVVPPTNLGPSAVSLDSTTGGVNADVTIGNSSDMGLQVALEITLDLVAEAKFNGNPFTTVTAGATVPNEARAQTVSISAKLLLDKSPGSPLNAGVENLQLNFSDLDLDVLQDIQFAFTIDVPVIGSTGFNLSLSQLGINPQVLTDAIIDPLIDNLGGLLVDLITPTLEQFVTDALQGLLEQLQLSFDFALPDFLGTGKPPVNINVYTELTSALFLDEGGQIGLALGAYTPKGTDNLHEPDGSIRRMGCLEGDTESLTYDWSHELGFGIQTDALNTVFFALWWSGFLHGPIDVSALLGGGSPLPIEGLVLDLDQYAAPVINDCTKAAGVQLEIGDLQAKVAGKLLALEIDATVFIDLRILVNFVGTDEGLMIELDSLQFMDVEVVAVGEGVSEADNRALLEGQLQPILESFLIGNQFGPIQLPALDFGGLIPGLTLPPGTDTELNLGPLEVSKDTGFVLIETDLD